MEAAEIDKELEELDTRLDQVRALYEQYFMGIDRIEPQKPRVEVERRIKVLRKEQIRNTGQRFKFNMLVSRFNTMQQYWGRVVREIENGTFKRDLIKAAARFGDQALTGVAKKRAKELSRLAAAKGAQAKRVVEEVELGADDLIEEDEDIGVEDEVPTPPKHVAPLSARGLDPGDLPVITQPPLPAPAPLPVRQPTPPPFIVPPAAAAALSLSPSQAAADPSAPAPSASQSGRSGGLRWGSSSSDPSSSIRTAPGDVKRRVAELAAELGAPAAAPPARPEAAPVERAAAGFGDLDLDFDDSPGPRRVAPGPAPAAPHAAPPRVGFPAQRAGALPAAAARAASPPAVAGSFGVLDIPLGTDDQRAAAVAPVPSPSSPGSPGSGIRTGMGARPAVQPAARPAVAAARPAPAPQPAPAARLAPSAPAGGGGGDDLSDQRVRQIYAKYVETKRATNESTAGVTFEKLAASLRAQAEKLKTTHPSKAIDYEVVVKDGKTHLKPVLR
jgi:hypothetical protein